MKGVTTPPSSPWEGVRMVGIEDPTEVELLQGLLKEAAIEGGLPFPPLWQRQGIKPEEIERVYGYAVHLHGQGYFEEAQTLLLFLMRLDPRSFRVWLGLGLTAQALGQPLEALIYFQRAAQQEPLDPRPPFHMAEVFVSIDQNREARLLYMQATALAYASPQAFLIKREAERRGEALKLHPSSLSAGGHNA